MLETCLVAPLHSLLVRYDCSAVEIFEHFGVGLWQDKNGESLPGAEEA